MTRRGLVLYLFGLLISSSSAAQDLREAIALLDAGRSVEAETLLERIARENPASADAHFFLGSARFASKRYAEAIPAFEAAVKLAPEKARGHRALGAAHAAMENYNLAEPHFRRACDQDPADADACYYFGRSLYALNRFEESIKVLAIAARSGHQPGRTYHGLGQAYEALGKEEEAEREFRKSLEAGWPEASTAYGVFLFRQGRLDEARSMLERAAAGQPRSARAHLELGRTLLQGNRPAQALAPLLRAVDLDPSSGAAHLLLAKTYQRLGRAAEADRHFDQGSRMSR